MTALYNEIDPFAAEWLRGLIKRDQIAPGVVKECSIEDLDPDELRHYTQCHFFAGIGVWSYALRRARWHDDRRVWTGSCPCQPLSQAGQGLGFADERHLWPAWFHLISQCEPDVIFGEQVASKLADDWIDLVHFDLEALDYAFGCVPFPSASVGAPHIRDRNYWLAYASQQQQHDGTGIKRSRRRPEHTDRSGIERLADVPSTGRGIVGRGRRLGAGDARPHLDINNNANRPGPVNGIWRDADWLFCRDRKWRPVEPGLEPLAHGAAARVGRLRGYGNAINAEQAKVFIEVAMSVLTA